MGREEEMKRRRTEGRTDDNCDIKQWVLVASWSILSG